MNDNTRARAYDPTDPAQESPNTPPPELYERVEGDSNVSEDTDPKTEQLVDEIEQTRADLSGTIDAIQERLSPQHLREEAKSLVTDATDAVREATIGKVERMASTASDAAKEKGMSFLDTIAANPIPAAMAAIGIGWLYMNRRNASSHVRDNRYEIERRNRYAGGYEGAYRDFDDRDEPSRGVAGKVSDTASGVAGKVGDTASGVASKVQGAAGTVADTVSDKASDLADLAGAARDKTGHALHSTQRKVSQVPGNIEDMVQSNPLVVAGTAVAIGAAIGLLLPESDAEHRMMGATRDQFMDQTRGLVKETTEKVQHIASEVAQTAQETAKEKAREEHLMPQS